MLTTRALVGSWDFRCNDLHVIIKSSWNEFQKYFKFLLKIFLILLSTLNEEIHNIHIASLSEPL